LEARGPAARGSGRAFLGLFWHKLGTTGLFQREERPPYTRSRRFIPHPTTPYHH
jgi:hypothetical protein